MASQICGSASLRELDGLGVAAALEVEDAVRRPAGLVVADQRAVRIGRQRGLAGAGQAEEQRAVAVLADVGRAVHRHHALRRQVEVQRGEHRLLDFARVGRAADQHDLAGEIDGDHRVGALAAAVTLGVGPERRHVDDGQLRHEARELGALWTDQQLVDEQRVPSELGVDARLDPILRIGAAIEVLREQRLALRVREKIVVEQDELRLRHLPVAVPPDGVFRQRIDNRVLVLRRAAGVMAGLGAERAAGDDRRLAVADRVLIELAPPGGSNELRPVL